MTVEKCGALLGGDGSAACGLPAGHPGAHAEHPDPDARSAEAEAGDPCDHRDEHGATLLIYLHQGARCMRCGAFVV